MYMYIIIIFTVVIYCYHNDNTIDNVNIMVKQFPILFQICQWYDLVIFTASMQVREDELLYWKLFVLILEIWHGSS